ncbi:hypothetical protein BJX66DRAFT_302418 [Aspergillus keveii]|uniref:Uncharacterized protein n=1 Tax=Aspergillus keveii TaxID=714993 RepID=A0ABR4G865_9EURO
MMELFADSAPSSMLPERPKGPVERDTEHREQRRSQADSNMELQGQLCRLGGPRKRNLFSRALLGVFRHRGARET